MKNTIKLGLASAIAVAMLTGCGGGGSPTKIKKDGTGRILIKSAIDELASLQSNLESLTGGVSALADSAANEALVDNLTDNVIVAGYAELYAKVGELTAALAVLETTPNAANLTAAQGAWRAARVPWESGEGHIFGPIDTQGVDPASDSWPVIKSDLDGSLGGWNPGDPTDAFADEVRGFHAIEYILFGSGETTNTRNISDLSTKQLAYVHSLGASMEGQMRILLNSWNNGYTATFKGLSPAEAAEELLGGVIGIADEVGHGKMGDPYNDKDTTLVESQFSWNSTTDFANNIISIKKVWAGGLGALMTQVNAAKAAVITTQIETAIVKIKKISDADGDGEIDVNVKDKAFRNQILN